MRRFVATLIVGFAVAACSSSVGSAPALSGSPVPAVLATSAQSESPTATPSPIEEPLPSDLDPDIRHAIESRRGLGLRHDLEYVLRVANDPNAHELLDFPWYPAEEAKFFHDQEVQQDAVEVIQAYVSAHRDEFGGLFIDREEQFGAVVSLWTRDLAMHEAAIRAKLPEGTPLGFRQVRYSEAELRELQDRIGPGWDWIRSIPAAPLSLGVDIEESVLVMEVSSADPDAPAIIRDHYRLGDKLVVVSDGTGAHLIPYGKVLGTVIGPDGRRIQGHHDLMVDAVSAGPGWCGGGDIGYGVREDGTFEYPCQVGIRTIQIKKLKDDADGEWTVIGEATVQLVGTGAVTVTIRLTETP